MFFFFSTFLCTHQDFVETIQQAKILKGIIIVTKNFVFLKGKKIDLCFFETLQYQQENSVELIQLVKSFQENYTFD